jgi:hypothetical protein
MDGNQVDLEEVMKDRRFVIREWGKDDPNPGWTITEYELKLRLFLVAKYLYTGGPKIDPISILIHGDTMPSSEEPIILSRAYPVSCDGASPSRQEWAEWKKNSPDYKTFGSYVTWTDAIREWILSMPIVPKEEI